MSQKFYCPAPWWGGHFTFSSQSICCSYKSSPGESPLTYIRSKEVQKVKEIIAGGQVPDGCQKCYKEEQQGFDSMRQRYISAAKRYGLNLPTDPTLPTMPKSVEVRFGNLCNFKCRMCHPDWSNLIGAEVAENESLSSKFFPKNQIIRHAASETFFDEMVELLPSLEVLYLTGGEPTVDKHAINYIYKAIDTGVAKNINLSFATNCSALNPNFLDALTKFKTVTPILSIDGVGPIAEYQRHGTVWKDVEHNVLRYIELSKQYPSIKPSLHVAVTGYSAMAIDQLIEFYINLLKHADVGIAMTVSNASNVSVHSLKGPLRKKAINSIHQTVDLLQTVDLNRYTFLIDIKNLLVSLAQSLTEMPVIDSEWNSFKDYTQTLDKIRGENFNIVFDENINIV